jgi:alkanesulfonate monooxygenase SsuD/methylene tetrahydromethanopterin reductase-like flavin-dependent oxidoreductase (luciferase family)
MPPRNAALVQGSRLKLGLFGANCSSGRTYATIPHPWVASWENNLKLAQLGDELGIEAMIPIARWRGYAGEARVNSQSFESITWASGLLAATRRINVFCTVHVSLIHPVIAAKQMATADHIGQGRLVLNLVCGAIEDEFQMFGIRMLEHDDRYAMGEEWWEIVRRIWATADGEPPFDFDGAYFQLHNVEGAPGPFGGQTPLVMNAGISPAGRAFAIRHSDLHFDGVKLPEASADRIGETRRLAREGGREVQVWTPVGMICRPTRREADEYMRYLVEQADRAAIGNVIDILAKDTGARTDPEAVARRNGEGLIERQVLARGAYCTVGDPDAVAEELARLHSVGFDGLALNFVDYLAELPYVGQEVLPRLERMGLRSAATPVSLTG